MRGWMLLGYKFPEFDNIISLSTYMKYKNEKGGGKSFIDTT
jgi:hypothetical protein